MVALGVDGLGVTTGTGAASLALGGLTQQAATIGVPVATALLPIAAQAATSGGNYQQLIGAGESALTAVAQQVLQQCPAAKLAFAGNGQGAQMLSSFLQGVGSGNSVIPADKVSAAALFGSPDRAAGSALFPGSTQARPSSLQGSAVAALPKLDAAGPQGGGVAASSTTPDFGALTGKVASLCQPGDLTCDMSADSPEAQAVSQIAGTGGDPVAALQKIAASVLGAATTTTAPGANSNVSHAGSGLLGNLLSGLLSGGGTGADLTGASQAGYTSPSTPVTQKTTRNSSSSSSSASTTVTASPNASGDNGCPMSERIDANQGTSAQIIAEVDHMDKDCPNTATTVVGHSYGAARAGDVAEHYGKNYTGHAKFVLNADPSMGTRQNLPATTVSNCNTLDPVCSHSASYATYFPWHMPDHYPASWDNNPAGINMIPANGSASAATSSAPAVQGPFVVPTTKAAAAADDPEPASTSAHNWDAVAQCESGGNWSEDTGNGYYGGLQFSLATWQANGGTGVPSNASKDEQIRVAENVLKTQGAGAWPTCGKNLGSAPAGPTTSSTGQQSPSSSQYVSDWFTAAAKDANTKK